MTKESVTGELFYVVPKGIRKIKFDDIPKLGFSDFSRVATSLLSEQDRTSIYPLSYHYSDGFLYLLLFSNLDGTFIIGSAELDSSTVSIPSLQIPSLYQFERDIFERTSIDIEGHPYLKPLRRPLNSDKFEFDTTGNLRLHEVNVGPVHAGIIEPGQFRFTCNGEIVLSVEVCLGFQRRGIEGKILHSDTTLGRMVLAEQIAGDSVIANSIAMASILDNCMDNELVSTERALALEMERLAMHLADSAALCGDAAYQLGQVSIEPLRTIVVNSLLLWCGSRSGRGLVRPGGSFYRLSIETIDKILSNIGTVEKKLSSIISNLLSSPSLLSRLDSKCILTSQAAETFGALGTVAKASSLCRDIRQTEYSVIPYDDFSPVRLPKGDLLSRLEVRLRESMQSIQYIRNFLKKTKSLWFKSSSNPQYDIPLDADCMYISPVEGFRGTILHMAKTDDKGQIADYRIFDPSVPMWPILMNVMSGEQISDFPLCNKSFNLSYLANDL